MLLEDRARIYTGNSRTAIRLLTGVGGCTDVDVEAAVAVEGNAFILVLPIHRESGDDRLGRAGGLELPGCHLHPLDRLRMRKVDVAVADRDPGRAATAERLFHLESAVAVRIAQSHSTAAGFWLPASAARHERDVEIAVGRRHHVSRSAEVVGDDQRTESGRQRDAAVLGIAHRSRLPADAGDQEPQRGKRAGDRDCTCSAEIHSFSPLLEAPPS